MSHEEAQIQTLKSVGFKDIVTSSCLCSHVYDYLKATRGMALKENCNLEYFPRGDTAICSWGGGEGREGSEREEEGGNFWSCIWALAESKWPG